MDYPSTTSFQQLDRVHEVIVEEFQLHQENMIQGDLKTARFHLNRFVSALLAHQRAEEEVLIPIFAERVPLQNGCTPDILAAEHKKMERLFQRSLDRMTEYEKKGEVSPREIIFLVEEDRMLKEVLSHHDIRERTSFFPLLDEVLVGDERKEVWEKCLAIQESAEALQKALTASDADNP